MNPGGPWTALGMKRMSLFSSTGCGEIGGEERLSDGSCKSGQLGEHSPGCWFVLHVCTSSLPGHSTFMLAGLTLSVFMSVHPAQQFSGLEIYLWVSKCLLLVISHPTPQSPLVHEDCQRTIPCPLLHSCVPYALEMLQETPELCDVYAQGSAS